MPSNCIQNHPGGSIQIRPRQRGGGGRTRDEGPGCADGPPPILQGPQQTAVANGSPPPGAGTLSPAATPRRPRLTEAPRPPARHALRRATPSTSSETLAAGSAREGTDGADGGAPDRNAFSDLYEAHAPRVYRYLLSRTSNPSDAEELTSRTFLRALAGLDQYRGRGAGFPAWLMSIAHNLLVNWYRDRGRRPPTEALDAALQIPSATPGPESSLEQNERIARVRAAVSALAPDRQQLIALKYVDGRSNAEIGRIMARTEGAVKALHHRTLRELQRLLGDEERGAAPREGSRR